MIKCVYCGQEKNDEEITKEHVLPQAIGGAISNNNPFLINVCSRCNSIAGFHIDSIFIKSWLIANSRSLNSRKFIDITKLNKPILPLTYLGVFESEELKNFTSKICDVWLGPAHDVIFHFHEKYPKIEDYPCVVGIHPSIERDKNNKIDYGEGFIYVKSDNENWILTSLFSFSKFFKKAKLYFGNGKTPKGGIFSNIPEEFLELSQYLMKISNEELNLIFFVEKDAHHRFLAKFALGIGAIVLEDAFVDSVDAKILRDAMWEKDLEKRKQIPVQGSSFLPIDTIFDHLKWEGGHLFVLMENNDCLVLYSSFYETNNSVVVVSRDKKHWENKFKLGLVYIVVPGLQRAVTTNLETFLAHKINKVKNQDIFLLEEEMSKFREIPPILSS